MIFFFTFDPGKDRIIINGLNIVFVIEINIYHRKDRIMKKWVSLILLTVVLAATTGGCKKGG